MVPSFVVELVVAWFEVVVVSCGAIQQSCTREASRSAAFGSIGPCSNDAAKHELQMLGRATEAVVEIDVAARGVDVVAPQQAGDPAAGPDAFGAPAELEAWPRPPCIRRSPWRLPAPGPWPDRRPSGRPRTSRAASARPALLRRLRLVLGECGEGRQYQNAAGQEGGGGTKGAAQHEYAPDAEAMINLRVRPQNLAVQRHTYIYHFATAQTRAIGLTRGKSCYRRIPVVRSLAMTRSHPLFALVACAIVAILV